MNKTALFAAVPALIIMAASTGFCQTQSECPTTDSIRAVNFNKSFPVPWMDWVLAIDQNTFRTNQQWSFKLLLTHINTDSDAKLIAFEYMPNLMLVSGAETTKDGKILCRYAINNGLAHGYAMSPPETLDVV